MQFKLSPGSQQCKDAQVRYQQFSKKLEDRQNHLPTPFDLIWIMWTYRLKFLLGWMLDLFSKPLWFLIELSHINTEYGVSVYLQTWRMKMPAIRNKLLKNEGLRTSKQASCREQRLKMIPQQHVDNPESSNFSELKLLIILKFPGHPKGQGETIWKNTSSLLPIAK